MPQYTREELRWKKVFSLENSAGAAIKGLLQLKDHFKPEDVVVVLFHDSGSRYVGKCLMMTGCANVVFLKREVKKAEDVIKIILTSL
jgi:cystathionine beta-synthase